MNELIFLTSVAALYAALAISPGPNFLVISMAAVSHSRRQATHTALGVSTASVLWASLAAAGLGVLIAQFAWIQSLLQIVGGVYLFYVGIKIVRNAPTPMQLPDEAAPAKSAVQAFRYGLVTNMTNPKSLAFFTSAFATLFTPGLATWAKIAAVAVVALISIGWNLIVVTAFSASQARRRYARAKCGIDRVTGALIACFGIKLILGK